MKKKIFALMMLGVCAPGLVGWSFNPSVTHRAQPETWACGPSTIAMWAGYINSATYDIYAIGAYCDSEDGTTIPEFMDGMYEYTPYGYVFSEWEYSDKQAAVKGIMWSISRFSQPVAVVGGNGTHYLLVRGGTADSDPYTTYSESNHINSVYVNDSTELSVHYAGPVSGMYKHIAYDPEDLMVYWTKTGSIFDKKYRSIERGCYACWSDQGATFNNNDNFSDY